jgi:hypothetical protein
MSPAGAAAALCTARRPVADAMEVRGPGQCPAVDVVARPEGPASTPGTCPCARCAPRPPCLSERATPYVCHQETGLRARLKATLPYGLWTCRGGREFLFNRYYEPLFTRRRPIRPLPLFPNGVPVPADPSQWVPNILTETWFYCDACVPWRNPATRRRLENVLGEWGVAP